MNGDQRKRCEDAGIPASEIDRIEDAVSGFDLPDLRDRAIDELIKAWGMSTPHP